MVPEKRSEMDIIFGHVGLFFALSPHKKSENQKFKKVKKRLEVLSFYTCTINDNHMMYGDRIFCHFGPFFKKKKKKKKTGHSIILHMCTINDNHAIMMHGS